MLCTFLGVKYLTTTAYHPQISGQVEQYDKTIVPSLCYYVAEHQCDWNLILQVLTYAYNTRFIARQEQPFSMGLLYASQQAQLPQSTYGIAD